MCTEVISNHDAYSNGFDRDDWLNEREAELSVREGAVARAERRLGEKEKKMTVTAN